MHVFLPPFRLCLSWLLAICWVLSTGLLAEETETHREQKPSAPAASRGESGPQRAIYFSKNASVASLVYVLEKHFEGDAGIKFVAEPNANLLSIRANSQAALNEVLKTLAQIDRPLRQVAVTMLLVEFTPPKDEAAAGEIPKIPVDLGELKGSADEVRRQLVLWARDGHVTSVRRFEMKTLENQPAQLMLGETKPIPAGFTLNGATGVATPTLTMRDFGTQVTLVARVKEAGEIDALLHFQETLLEPPERGIEMAKGVNGPIVSPATSIKRLDTTISVPNGQSSVTTDFAPGSQSGHAPTAIVISARIVEPGESARGAKSDPPQTTSPPVPPGNPQRPTSESPAVRSQPGGGIPSTTGTAPRRSSFGGSTSLVGALRDEEFAKRINLTEKQRSQMDQIRTEMFDAFRKGGSRDEMPIIMKQFEQKYVDLLTDEQKKIWAERQAELLKKAAESDAPRPETPASPSSTKPAATDSAREGNETSSSVPRLSSGFGSSRSRTSELLLTQLQNRAFVAKLNLSDEQQRQLDLLKTDKQTAITEWQNGASKATEELEKQSVGLLTEEQQKVWIEEQKRRTEKRRADFLSRHPEALRLFPPFLPPERLFLALWDQQFREKLKISDEQFRKWERFQDDYSKAVPSASEMDKSFEDRALALLTNEQQQIWKQRQEELRQQRPATMGTSAQSADSSASSPRAVDAEAPRARGTFPRPGFRSPRGTPAERLAAFNESLNKDPDNADLLEQRADVHVELQQWDQATADLRAAIKMEPSTGRFINLAALLAYREDHAACHDELRRLQLSLNRNSTPRYDAKWICIACLLLPEESEDRKQMLLWLTSPYQVELNSGAISSRPSSPLIPLSDETRQMLVWQAVPRRDEFGMQSTDGLLDLLHGHPLLAIRCFQSQLDHPPLFPSYGRVNEDRVRLYLAMAVVQIGDGQRAATLLNDAETKLGSAPSSVASAIDHVLLRQARLSLAKAR